MPTSGGSYSSAIWRIRRNGDITESIRIGSYVPGRRDVFVPRQPETTPRHATHTTKALAKGINVRDTVTGTATGSGTSSLDVGVHQTLTSSIPVGHIQTVVKVEITSPVPDPPSTSTETGDGTSVSGSSAHHVNSITIAGIVLGISLALFLAFAIFWKPTFRIRFVSVTKPSQADAVQHRPGKGTPPARALPTLPARVHPGPREPARPTRPVTLPSALPRKVRLHREELQRRLNAAQIALHRSQSGVLRPAAGSSLQSEENVVLKDQVAALRAEVDRLRAALEESDVAPPPAYIGEAEYVVTGVMIK